MKEVLSELKQHRKGLVLGPLFKLVEAVLELLVPVIMAGIIDIGVKSADRSYVLRHGGILLLLGALGVVAAIICQYYAAVVSGQVGRSLRQRVYRHVLSLSGRETGDIGAAGLITRLTVDVNQVQTAINMAIRLAVRAPFLAVGSIVMALLIHPAIGTVFLVSTPLIVLVLYHVMKRSLPSYRKIQEGQDRLSQLSGENLEGARVIRAFSRQGQEKEEFRAASEDLTVLLERVGRVSAALNPLTSVIVNLAIGVIVWMGGQYAFRGGIEPGGIIALVSYMNQTLLALVVVANLVVLFTRAIASAGRLQEALATTPSVTGPETVPDRLENAAAVEFRDVSFAYHDGADDALEQISFSIGRGQTVGLIGGTGSGKSTIANLIERHYDAGQGEVLVNGRNVRDYPPSALRQGVGLVPQKAVLFSGTIRRNLRMAAPRATDEELWRALTVAQGEAFVRERPEGLDALLEEGGKNLSGGQRQRLTIARALVGEPDLLILDDSASALDYATDAALRRALAAEKERHPALTVLLISQRVSAIQGADSILVLDDGRLTGQGTHEELLRNNKVYREICASQGVSGSGEGAGA